MMIPFMGAQSLVIGKMFGEGFQYGKRKISAMPNEEFNKLTFQDMMSNAREELKASVPTMQAALGDMAPLVDTVVREFFNYISQVTKIVTGTGEGPRIFQEEGEQIGEAIAHGLGTHLPAAHAGTASTSIPVTPQGPQKPFQLPTSVPVGTTFTRTLAQAQADTSASRGTGIIRTEAGKKAAGQSQKLEFNKLTAEIVQLSQNLKASINALATRTGESRNQAQASANRFRNLRVLKKQALANLLARYRF